MSNLVVTNADEMSGNLSASSARTIAQRPMINAQKNYLFMILHFPIIKDGNVISGEIDFFVGHGYLITLHNNNLKLRLRISVNKRK